ncbi:hypothetical protein D8674_042040 [Pyrus ussuriensis x Pyrus communis]|uniref:Uncharacterized protein n=1 Tax=Pyrus ussuriensis x Pyrus communis TaxID=2448454 RepID=A0A5N5H399_9ROSA|nr:hypothetical protein D8674_042040 [Pyrus ussuriensis x Pyrus communis]
MGNSRDVVEDYDAKPKKDKTAGRDVQKKNGKVVGLASGEARFSGLRMMSNDVVFLGFSTQRSCALVHHSFMSHITTQLKACSSLVEVTKP